MSNIEILQCVARGVPRRPLSLPEKQELKKYIVLVVLGSENENGKGGAGGKITRESAP